MTRRPRFLPPPVDKRVRPASRPWVTRTIVIAAVVVVAVALAYTIATGTLFMTPSGR